MGTTATRHSRWIELAVALVLVAASLSLRTVHHAHTEVSHPLRADACGYTMAAANLKTFGVYSRDRPPAPGVPPERRTKLQPGYPLFLVPFAARGRSDEDFVASVVRVQEWIGALLPALTLALARTALSLPGPPRPRRSSHSVPI